MLFNSLHFLVFFPIVTILYFCLPHKIRWVWLLIASYYFYMSWNPKYAILIAISTLITYASGLLINKSAKQSTKKLWVALSFISNLSILFFFKYFDFVLGNINNALTFFNITNINNRFDILLPVGISFYTFQALSYTMDVYRKEIPAERNLGKYALFVSFFPQLVAGPIERSKNLLKQIYEVHVFDYSRAKSGLLLMLWGLFQKIIIADRAAILVNHVYADYTSGVQVLAATVIFAVQIYCDFAGYSNIAMGAAEVMGFRLMDNFNAPYFAASIRDFWRRWHISLSTWFKDYLYFPLGGSRCSKLKKYRNTMITFLVSGLWHGANWTFVVWGGLHGIYQVVEDLFRSAKQGKPVKQSKIITGIKIFVTFALVNFAWIFFRAQSVGDAFAMIKLFINPQTLLARPFTLGLEGVEILIMLMAIVVLAVVDYNRINKPGLRLRLAQKPVWFRWPVYLVAIFSLLIFGMYGPGFD